MPSLMDFICDVCDVLEIAVPAVSYDTSNFLSQTMMAQTNPNDYTIYIMKPVELNPDILFAVAHELRHLWQMVRDKRLFFSNYQPANKFTSVEEYNLQIAEIDANAFAGLIMMEFFGVNYTRS